MTKYQVVGECAHIVATDHSGVSATVLLYKGAPVPDGVDPDRLKHLLSVGLIAEVGDVPVAPNASVDQDPAVGIPPLNDDRELKPDGPDEAKRAEARAKLKRDADGKYQMPHANAGEDVWVAYAVTQGTDLAEAEKAGKQALVELFKQK